MTLLRSTPPLCRPCGMLNPECIELIYRIRIWQHPKSEAITRMSRRPWLRNQNQKIFLHPAALLAAMLASAYFLSNEKDSTSGNGSLVLAAASLAAIWIGHQADSVFKFLEGTLVFQANVPSDDKAIHVAEIAILPSRQRTSRQRRSNRTLRTD
jgi:hypothetical protein